MKLSFKAKKNENFEAKISEQIAEFSVEQKVYFAGLCALRALPFLCSTIRNFSFFPPDKKQKYLYAIFNAIDTNLKYQNNTICP
ncbi:MAG: hypothetical protein FWH37_07665 [Candidatus Bathyarchaeota archaeon]|nr:hypothetical protein [Candidatus Termiticorpusculum sp.]